MADAPIVKGYVPGSIGRVAELHGAFYARHQGFGAFFEAKVASELAEFVRRYDASRDGFWTASLEGRVEGAVVIDGIRGRDEGAHLRWFIVSDAWRGRGLGGRLLETGIEWCRQCGYANIHLWTFAGLDAARHLYEKAGFTLTEQRVGKQWGTEVLEQRFDLWVG